MLKKNKSINIGNAFNVLNLFVSVIGIITSFVSSKIAGAILISISVLSLIIWITIGAVNFFKAKKAIEIFKNKFINNNMQVVADLHSIFHDIRDSSSIILKQNVTDVESLDRFFKEIEKNICTKIEALFDQLWNKSTCVCIKMISANDLYNDDYKTWKVYTYSRGNRVNNSIEQSGRAKNDQEPVYIIDNSDFEIIVNGTVDYYVCENMKNIKTDFKISYTMEYNNSREKQGVDISKYYNATIVLPIRIQIDNRVLSNGNCKGFHLLGFLCIDTLDAFTVEEKNVFYLGAEYAKAISDTLYNQILCYFKARMQISNKAVSSQNQ